HPLGFAGTPSRGQYKAAASNASWTASSAASKSPDLRTSVPRTSGARSRSRSPTLEARSALVAHLLQECLHLGDIGRRFVHYLPHLDWLLRRGTARSRHGGDLRRDLDGARLRVHFDDLIAGQPLLELLERTIGDHWRVQAVRRHNLGEVGSRQHLGIDQLTAADQLLVQGFV